ncbi:MAG: transglycosylase domain-containing protein [Jatrophihabitans sp.]
MPEQYRPGQAEPPSAAAEPAKQPGRWRRRRALKKRRLARMSRRKRILRRVGLAFTWLLGLFALLVTVLAFGVYSVAHVPSPDELRTNQTAVLQYADGSTIATIDGGENRTDVPLSKVPVYVRDAVLAAEDRGFYSEPGVSIRGTLRAALNDVRGGSTQGGSTITQQYVKNAYLSSDQTLSRKLKELAISLKLSRQYSKDDILGNYLNTIYFGRRAYGIQAAAKAYFGVDISKVTVAQGALLAAVIKSPEYYDPAVTPSAAQDRWDYVVNGMVTTGKLSPAQRDGLKFPTTIKTRSVSSTLDGPLGLVWRQVKSELTADGIDPATINTKGLRIQTTIDPSAQRAAQAAISQNFTGLQPFQKNLLPALAAVNPATGGVLAYYGGSDGTGFDYANGYRPPGSSFKPYTLAAALTQNIKGVKPAYALDSVFDGSYCVTIQATQICNDPGDRPDSGFKTLAYAMKVSLNTTYDGLANTIGPPNVATIAHAMGISKTRVDTGKPTLVDAGGTTTFGIGIGDADYSVRPLDQATGFATIANGGTTHQPYFISKVTDASGSVLYQHKDAGVRSLDPRVANDVGLSVKPVADWSHVPLNNGRESGAKTGTAGIQGDTKGNNSDAWMVGYTPQVSAAVWVGSGKTQPIYNANQRPEYGSDLPGHIWRDFMDSYLTGKPALPLPTKQQVGNGSDAQPSSTPTPSQSSSQPTSQPASSTPARSSSPVSPPPSNSTPPPSSSTPTPTPSCTPLLPGGPCPTPSPTGTASGG